MSIQFSIIIPVYNVEGYVGKCLESIIKQEFTNFEVILVNDGSSDLTGRICDEYAQKDNRVQVIHKKNEGVSIARNIAIDRARGKFLLFFDGDDFVEPYCLKELNEIVDSDQKIDTVIYGYHRYENQTIKETCLPIFNQRIYEGEAIMQYLVPKFIGVSDEGIEKWLCNEKNALYVENPALWHCLVSAQVVKNNNIRFNKELKVGEDTIFISEYLSHASKCYIQQKCYYYLVTRESSTIYQYERNPVAKLEGKLHLLKARIDLSRDIKKRRNYDITPWWRGTVVMSSIEMAFLMSDKKNKIKFRQGYQYFLEYTKKEEVCKLIKEFSLKVRFNIKCIPFLLLKMRCYFLLYIATYCLHLVGYEFNRN